MLSLTTLLSLLACPMNATDAEGAGGSQTDDAPDDDRDGFTADEDCDDGDDSVFPGAPDSCDGVDRDCDGQDADPATPVAVFVDEQGNGGDASAAIVSAAGYTPPPGRLYVCGGEWELNLDIDSDLAVVASDATFTGRVEARPLDSATISLDGGTWNSIQIFEAGSDVSIANLTLGGGYVNVRSGRMSLDGVTLAGGVVHADASELALTRMDLAGDSLVVQASETDLIISDVTVSSQVEENVLRLDGGSVTIDGLSVVDSPSRFFFYGVDALVTNSHFERADYPLYFGNSTAVVTDCSLTDSTGGFHSYGGSLEVDGCAFSGTIAAYSVYATGDLTVRNSTFTGATNDGTLHGYEIGLDVTDTGQALLVEDCVFSDAGGGAYQIFANGPTVIRRSQFERLENTPITFGDYGSTPIDSATLDGLMRVEDTTFTDLATRVFSGTLCPSFVDVEITGLEAYDVAQFTSYDGPLSCTSFGERLRIADTEVHYVLKFENAETNFGCTDCEMVGNTADSLVFAEGGTFSFFGGAIAPNPLYSSNTSALFVRTGRVALEDVDLGEGADENPGDDIWVGSQRYDGSGVTTISCSESGCE